MTAPLTAAEIDELEALYQVAASEMPPAGDVSAWSEADKDTWLAIFHQWMADVRNSTKQIVERLPRLLASARMGVEIRDRALEEAAGVAECHFDDRPYRNSIDWNDGHEAACRGAATAIRALQSREPDDA